MSRSIYEVERYLVFRLWFHLQGMLFWICPNLKTQTTFAPKHFWQGMLLVKELLWLNLAEVHRRLFSWTRMKLNCVSAASILPLGLSDSMTVPGTHRGVCFFWSMQHSSRKSWRSIRCWTLYLVLGAWKGELSSPNCRQWMVCSGMVIHRCRPLQGYRTERVTTVSVGKLEPSQLGAENLVSVFQRKQPVSKV